MTSTSRLFLDSAASVAAGIAATLPMSGVMFLADAAGKMGTQPPRRVVDEAAAQSGSHPSDAARDAGAALLHLLFGGLMAVGILPATAAFAWVRGAIARGVAAGLAFGAALYALNYAGLAPALGILPPPSRDRPGRQLTMVAAHLVYGVAVGVLVNLFVERGREG
jgi:hypothetical protein